MSSIAIVSNEKQTLRCIVESPDLLLSLDDNYFVSETGRALYDAVQFLYASQVALTAEHLLTEGNSRSASVTANVINELMSQDFQLESFETYYLPRLKRDRARSVLSNGFMNDLRVVLESKDELDLEKTAELLNTARDVLTAANNKKSVVMTAADVSSAYVNVIHKRNTDHQVWYSGCSHLDSYTVAGAAPKTQTTLFAATGIGKSAYALYLINKQINRRIPCIYFSLEMDLVSTMDRLAAMRLGVDMRELHPWEGDIQPHILEAIRKEAEKLRRVKSFFFVEEPGLSIEDVERIIADIKKRYGFTYMIVTVDLLTMLREFSGNDAQAYEGAMNRWHEVCKRQNVHFINVVQANRNADSSRISAIDQLQYLRPRRNHVKNSQAILERSRIALSVFRPKFYAEQLFPDDPEVLLMDDIMEIQWLKQSQGGVGGILRYRYDGRRFKITPIIEEPVVTAAAEG